MLKRILIFLSLVPAAGIVYWQSRELFLAFFVVFPAILLPVFLFFEMKDRLFLSASLAVALGVYGIYLLKHPGAEMVLYGFTLFCLGGLVAYDRRNWERLLGIEKSSLQNLQQDLEVLSQRHLTRLESLHHLEKQVASLLDLFEISRDFNDCMSLETLVDILLKRVMPELPCEEMRLIILKKNEEAVHVASRFFTISKTVVVDGNTDWSQDEIEALKKILESKVLLKAGAHWFFPLIAEGELAAILHVQGADPADLAKFEVLAAHLVLQVRKAQLYETVKELSIRDSLTGIFVRRHFLERLADEFKRCRKYGMPLALLMLDIDHFKRYNDEFGHLVGDATLKEVAQVLRSNLRNVDVLARYGGEEFVIVIPETKQSGAQELAERIRSNVARHRFRVYDRETRVTLSVGIVLYPDDLGESVKRLKDEDIPFELIRRADKALYRAKEEGRNRVVSYKDL